MLDCLKPITHKKLIEHELEGFGIRLNKKPPAITFRRKEKGGINFSTAVSNPKLDLEGTTSYTMVVLCCSHAASDGAGLELKLVCMHLQRSRRCVRSTGVTTRTSTCGRTATWMTLSM